LRNPSELKYVFPAGIVSCGNIIMSAVSVICVCV